MDDQPPQVAYLLYNERPMSGLIRSQVIPVLAEIQRLVPGCRITVIAVTQPWLYFSSRSRVDSMRRELESRGIRLENRPIALFPSRYFLYNHLTLPLLVRFVRLLHRGLGLRRFQLIHARAYMAGLAAAGLKERYGYRFIFDMRSLFPEENVTSGKWALGSPVYLAWKRYERFTLERSDARIAVSAPMKQDADRIAPPREADLIPLNVELARLGFDPAAREIRRREVGWDDCYVLAYVGGLAVGTSWNNVRNYADYFSRLAPLAPRLRMVFLVPEANPAFLQAFREAGIEADRIRFVQGAEDIRAWLSAADAGIQVMSPGPDSRTRFGVKVVEYLASGLPVICNSNAGAAADFLEESGAGVRLDIDANFESKARTFFATRFSRTALADLAKENFSLPVIGRKYGDLYRRLLGEAATIEKAPARAATR